MKHLVFTPDRNSVGNDFKGAFKPESDRYTAFYTAAGDEVEVRRIDVSKPSRARVVAMMDAFDGGPFDRLAFFCHGWRSGMQLGLSRDGLDLVAVAMKIAHRSTPALRVALYCCSTGASNTSPTGDGGFADYLRDCLVTAGRPDVSVFAHTTAGHTTRNAAVRWFVGESAGVDLVKRGTPEARRLYERLHDVADPLRWQLPYLTLEQALAELK